MKSRWSKSVNPKLAVAYLRVSTADQAIGPEAQRAAIEKWATANTIEVIGWHIDQGVGGATDAADRPGLVAAVSQIRAEKAAVLVVAKRDRIARDIFVAGSIERLLGQSGAKVICADGVGNGTSPTDELMRGVVDLMAAYERALIKQRTVAALAVKRARMEYVGNAPYGYRVAADGKLLEQDPTEQAILREVRDMRASGLSYRQIQREGASRGLVSRKGTPFALTALVAMLVKDSDESKVA